MTRLIVMVPKRPLMPGVPQRFQYRVELPNGKLYTLKTIAEKLRIPYASLSLAVRSAELPTGYYSQEFVDIVARVRRNMHSSKIPATIRCAACSGTGRVPNVAPATPAEVSDHDQP